MLTQVQLESQPNLPLTGHECSNGARFASGVTKSLGCQRAWNKLGKKCDNADENRVAPSKACVQETEISLEARKSKILPRNSVWNYKPWCKHDKK